MRIYFAYSRRSGKVEYWRRENPTTKAMKWNERVEFEVALLPAMEEMDARGPERENQDQPEKDA